MLLAQSAKMKGVAHSKHTSTNDILFRTTFLLGLGVKTVFQTTFLLGLGVKTLFDEMIFGL